MVSKTFVVNTQRVVNIEFYKKQVKAINYVKAYAITKDGSKMPDFKVSDECFAKTEETKILWDKSFIKIYASRGESDLYDFLYSEGILQNAFKKMENIIKLKAFLRKSD